MVRDAVQHDQAPAVQRALGHREAAPGHHVRVEPGGPLGQHDLVRADRVAGAGGGQRVVDQVQHAARGLGFMIVAKMGAIWPELAMIMDLPAGGVRTACSASRRVRRRRARGPRAWSRASSASVRRPSRQARRAASTGRARSSSGSRARAAAAALGLVDGQAERGQAAGRGVERGQRRGPVPRAPQRRRPSVGPGEPEPAAQRLGQYSLGQDHGTDRVGGRVPPGNRGRERESAGRHVRVVEAARGPGRRRADVITADFIGSGERKGRDARTYHPRAGREAELHEGRAGDRGPGGARSRAADRAYRAAL